MSASTPALGGMQLYLLPLFDMFKDPNVAIGLAAAMLVVAIIVLIIFVMRQMRSTLAALRRVQTQLETVHAEARRVLRSCLNRRSNR